MFRALLLAWILSAPAVAAQAVEGHVVNSVTGVAIVGVRVSLFQSDRIVYSTTTDSQGHFRFDSVKDGAYTAGYRARAGAATRSVFPS